MPSTPRVLPSDWGFPGFFEIGTRVRLSPAADPVDTSNWLTTTSDAERRLHYVDDVEGPASRFFVYSEPDPTSGGYRRLAVRLPRPRRFATNGQITAHWGALANAFDFGVEGSATFGNLSYRDEHGIRVIRPLKARFEYAGVNVQDAEMVYDIEGSSLSVLEHKGLVPELPVSFERITIYDRSSAGDDKEPTPVEAGADPFELVVGLRSRRFETWKSLEVFDAREHRIVHVTDDAGNGYFVAVPLASRPTAYLGAAAVDGAVGATSLADRNAAENEAAGALIAESSAAETVLSGRAHDRADVIRCIDGATEFLRTFDHATHSLRQGNVEDFSRYYAHSLLDSYRSAHDPRAVTEVPYGDSALASNAAPGYGGIGFARDQPSVLTGLVSYFRRTRDRTVLESIGHLAESTAEAITPLGSVWARRFDEMGIAAESDPNTGRADAFIDNGGMAVNFNHAHLVLERSRPRTPGITWGALEPVIDGTAQPVDGAAYRFAIDPTALGQNDSVPRESLGVDRLFARVDGRVRVRERAQLQRGAPFVRIDGGIENTGSKPLHVDEVRVTLGDFFQYGAGIGEIAQNRYGFGRSADGFRIHLGFWMEGMPAPIWGDTSPPGWVDVTDSFDRYRARFLCVFGYDRAALYYLEAPPSAVTLYNGADGAAPGWTTLQVRYKVGADLAPGEVRRIPAAYAYVDWAPLFSADDDTIPDELQSLAPVWARLVATVKDDATDRDRERRLQALSDPEGNRLRALLHNTLESDDGYASMQGSLMEAADLYRDLAGENIERNAAAEFARRASVLRSAALRGAEFTLRAMEQLRSRPDLMPAFGTTNQYGMHVLVFDWAYRETCDSRYRDAMLATADRIAASERSGGLQVADPDKPNYGAFVINEFSRDWGANDLDDQGAKLLALRIAYERTGDEKYERSARLFIDHWVKVRAGDHMFWGTSKRFDRYVAIGPDRHRMPNGHYSIMVGLRAWSDRSSRARELWAAGLENATSRHVVHALGTSGPYEAVFPDEGIVDLTANADVGGKFLWAMTFENDQVRGSWGSACGAR
jgi:hypothetical protein